MLKRLLIAFGAFVILAALAIAIGFYYFSPNKHHILGYLEDHPDNTAITWIRNEELQADRNSDVMMPLASTVKIIIAIEYGEQAASGLIKKDSLVALSELDHFYVQGTDGGAHLAWLNEIVSDSASVKEIARGMLHYSSNANTEWLSGALGLGNINARIDSLGIQDHSPVYYLVSALFVGNEKFQDVEENSLIDSLRSLSRQKYIATTFDIHQKLKMDTTYRSRLTGLSLDVQKVWSDRLPASTTAEYAGLMKKLNSKSYFDPGVQQNLDEVMEWVMDNPANQQWLEHSGMKGGSTAFVLTKALYATDNDGNTTEMAFFLNDLSFLQTLRLQGSMNAFELAILTDSTFRADVREALTDN